MKILLHIGQSKTGTSAIQEFLTLNRRRLQAAGIAYPMPKVNGLTVDVGHHNPVADSLLGVRSYPLLSAESYFQQFYADCRRTGAERMILSAEHFWGGHPRLWDVTDENTYWSLYCKKLENLASYLRDHEVSILVYLRPQVDWLASVIGHNVCFGWIPTRGSVVANLYKSDGQHFDLHKPVLRYCKLLDMWNEILAPASIVAVPYAREELFQRSSISDFLLRAKLDHINFPVRAFQLEVNDSLSREYVEVKKILNRAPKTMSVERAIIECLRRLSRQSPLNGGYRLQRDMEAQVEDYVAADNVRLAERYMNGHQFAAKSKYAAECPVPTQEQIAAAMQRFQNQYRRASFKLRVCSAWLRRFLRGRIPPVHAILHQLKRAQRRLRHG